LHEDQSHFWELASGGHDQGRKESGFPIFISPDSTTRHYHPRTHVDALAASRHEIMQSFVCVSFEGGKHATSCTNVQTSRSILTQAPRMLYMLHACVFSTTSRFLHWLWPQACCLEIPRLRKKGTCRPLTQCLHILQGRRHSGPVMMSKQETKLDGEKFGKERLQQVLFHVLQILD
jgi:hypothetical protein